MHFPSDVAVDSNDNIYIADWLNQRVRKVDVSSNIITTIIGNGNGIYSGDGDPAINAGINPINVAFDNQQNLYIADYSNHRIRKVDNNGVITTVGGTIGFGYNGDNIQATSAQLYQPEGVAIDTCGNIYIADKSNRRIRKVTFNDTCGQTSTSSIVNKQKEFSIYPNPVTSQFTISGEYIQNISITNTIGQIVYWQKASAEKTVVDMSVLHAGVYFVTVTDKQGVKVTKRVMKE